MAPLEKDLRSSSSDWLNALTAAATLSGCTAPALKSMMAAATLSALESTPRSTDKTLREEEERVAKNSASCFRGSLSPPELHEPYFWRRSSKAPAISAMGSVNLCPFPLPLPLLPGGRAVVATRSPGGRAAESAHAVSVVAMASGLAAQP